MSDAHAEAVKTDLSASGTSEPPSKGLGIDDLPKRLSKGFQKKLTYTNSLYQEYPLVTTFIVVFAALSAIPILTFCGTSIFILSTFLLVSTGFALCSALAIISLFGVALLAFLTFAFIAAFFLTGTAVGTYLTARLLFHIRSEQADEGNGGIMNAFINGLKFWFAEIRFALLHEVQFVAGALPASRLSSFTTVSSGTDGSKEEVKPILTDEKEETT